MKKNYILLAVLFACAAIPAAAQSFKMPLSDKKLTDINNKVTRSISRAAEDYRRNARKNPDALPPQARQDAAHATPVEVCTRCGEAITSAYQHCTATHCTGLCGKQPDKAAPQAKKDIPASHPVICPDCGETYTIDEQYHGIEHVCTHKHEVCAACGEKITSATQHCTAKNHAGLCSTKKEQNPAAKQTEEPASACPDCGHPYMIDEKYHGTEHRCAVNRGGNGGEPECGPIFVSCGEPVQAGGNGGEPETDFFCVYDDSGEVGPTGGEPQTPYMQEVDPGAITQAEALLQADRDAHNGKAQHSLEYYYKQVVSHKNAKK